ncbi:PREDICTED: uncharacterized protein LOC105457337 [Wasmannia auropunctata]|uniref:uncharacterized protein LOC105457337 n=1 Tax=Wasmannia auropunctata TaxID=64793 RepID=UPI0005EFC761|nr:PREDICTED: uncharacterized protein LOC105457337 [Wasmannia auropunctata]
MLKIIRFYDVRARYHLNRMYAQKRNIGNIGADLQKTIEKIPRIRSPNQPPRIWKQIEKVNKDGKLTKFTIQEIPEDRYEDVVKHMCTYLIPDEPICQCLNAKDDPVFVQDMSMLWRLTLIQGISIATFTDNLNGEKPIIASVNLLGIDFKNQKNSMIHQFKSENCRKAIETTVYLSRIVYDYYEIDKYLYSVGLWVNSDYRGFGLSKDMLEIRKFIGLMYGVPVTASGFTSIIMQKSAANAGFEELLTKNYSDLVDKDGHEYFPGIKEKTFKVMSKKLKYNGGNMKNII